MPLPIATIGLSLIAAGLKIFGSESKVLEFATHPLDLLTGHLLAENTEELVRRLSERFNSYQRITNEDLDKAVTRSVLLANLFCLLDALPPETDGIDPWSQLRKRFRRWLPETLLNGAISQGEQSIIHAAIDDLAKRLQDLKKGILVPTMIDPFRLVLPERGGDWGAKLASESLADLRTENADLPDRLDSIFQRRWFPYLCLAFQDQIKTNERVYRIFQSAQNAIGFTQIEEVIHEETERARKDSRERHEETHRLLVELKGAVGIPSTSADKAGARFLKFIETLSVVPDEVLERASVLEKIVELAGSVEAARNFPNRAPIEEAIVELRFVIERAQALIRSDILEFFWSVGRFPFISRSDLAYVREFVHENKLPGLEVVKTLASSGLHYFSLVELAHAFSRSSLVSFNDRESVERLTMQSVNAGLLRPIRPLNLRKGPHDASPSFELTKAASRLGDLVNLWVQLQPGESDSVCRRMLP